jgi:uncharacterized protein (TIGR00730 family)
MDKARLEKAPLAYENPDFLNSPDGRILRILAEYAEPLARFRRERIQDTVVFFGSARFANMSTATNNLQLLAKPGSKYPAPPEEQPATLEGALEGRESALKLKRAQAAVEMARYYEEARKLAYMLTKWSMKLPFKRHRFVVTSGGGPGIMEAANLGASEAGGKTIGLNINLPFEQFPNRYITPELNFEFHYFFMRKLWFAHLAYALIAFPGGFGTFDELFEIVTWAQIGLHAKPIGLLDSVDYFAPLLALVVHAANEGFVPPAHAGLLMCASAPAELLDRFAAFTPMLLDEKWSERLPRP